MIWRRGNNVEQQIIFPVACELFFSRVCVTHKTGGYLERNINWEIQLIANCLLVINVLSR